MDKERPGRGPRARLSRWVSSAVLPRVEIAKMIPHGGWRLVAPLVAMNLVAGAIPVVFVIATSVMIGRVPAAVDAGVDSPEWGALVAAFAFAAGAFLLAQVLAPLVTVLNSRLRRRIDGRLREEIMELINQTTSVGPMEDEDVLNELSEATRQFDSDWHTPGQAVGGLISLLARYGSLLAFCVLLSAQSFWWAGVAMLVVTMLFRYANRGGLRRFSAVWRIVMPVARRRDYLRELSMGDSASKETRIFRINDWLAGRYDAAYWDMYGPVGVARRRIYFYGYIPVTIIGLATTAWVVYSVGAAAASGTIGLTALAISLQAVMGAISLGQQYEEADVPTQFGMRAVEAIRRLRDRIDAAVADEAAHTVATASRAELGRELDPGSSTTALPAEELRFRNVTFAYPGTPDNVLDGLDLTIPAGRSTAIVGVNGAGKTTLVKLLTRLYEPTAGSITADGFNIAQLDAAAWRAQVSVIFQDFIKYEFSAADNIAMGAINAARDDAAIATAARKAGILEALESHPLGLDTPLARAYEDGIDLSGGQWQRVAIARSLYALSKGAKVLVLDEPTSALDVRAEVAFFDKFVELTQGVTSILISHRFSSVRRADHIVVIDGGRVSEQGSHAELMAAGGHYARLFTLQADRFARGLDAEGEALEDVQAVDAPIALTEDVP